MNCKEYYTSVDAIKGAGTITAEAYEAAKAMYQSGWGWQYSLNHLKEEEFSIVRAFNLAQNLKESVINSENRLKTLKKEAGGLWHFFSKRNRYEVTWVYQRNIVLGILYYLLAFDDSTKEEELRYLEQRALYMGGIKNELGMAFFNVFKEAVAQKAKTEIKEPPKEKDNISVDKQTALVLFHKIFREGLDMDKVGTGIRTLLEYEPRKGTLLFTQQRHWYIVYQWFREIGFIEKGRTASAFREWAKAMFGRNGYSTNHDFDEAKKLYGGLPSTWKPIADHTDYTDIRDFLTQQFGKDQRDKYLIKDRYIQWH